MHLNADPGREPGYGRTRAVTVAALSAVLTLSCDGQPSLGHVPRVNTVPLEARTVLDAAGGRRLVRIFEIDLSNGKEPIRLVTSHGVIWIGLGDQPVRRVDFSKEANALFPVRSLRQGDREYFAGFDPGRELVAVFDADGQQVETVACKGCWDLLATRLDSNSGDALIARAMDGSAAVVLGVMGHAERRIGASGYLTHIDAIHLEGEEFNSLVFYSSPDPEWGAAVRIKGPDGADRYAWSIEAAGTVAVSTPPGGGPALLSLDGDDLVEWDPATGKVLSTTPIAGSSMFRQIHSGGWDDGSRVVVLSGGPKLPKHMVVVIAPDRSVLYQAVGDGHVYAMSVVAGSRMTFLLAAEGVLKRYSPSALAATASTRGTRNGLVR